MLRFDSDILGRWCFSTCTWLSHASTKHSVGKVHISRPVTLRRRRPRSEDNHNRLVEMCNVVGGARLLVLWYCFDAANFSHEGLAVSGHRHGIHEKHMNTRTPSM